MELVVDVVVLVLVVEDGGAMSCVLVVEDVVDVVLLEVLVDVLVEVLLEVLVVVLLEVLEVVDEVVVDDVVLFEYAKVVIAVADPLGPPHVAFTV